MAEFRFRELCEQFVIQNIPAMQINFRSVQFIIVLFVASSFTGVHGTGDWPMWRYDQGRKAFAEVELPGNPGLIWTRQLEEPRRAWPFQYEDYFTSGNPDRVGKVSFDISYEPVAGGGMLFVPSMVSDRLTAYSAADGEEVWRYYAGGPVRFAPVYDDGNIYFVSDDGYLYCLDAGSGDLLWKYNGSYSPRMVLGNERIISMWPARGGPVISGGVIYFAAGVMPFEGVFIHAVDAESGEKIWANSTSGNIWSLHQHGGAYSYGGPSPQGYLAVSGDKLIVPGGRTPPAVYGRHSGEFLYFNQATGMVGKGAGGYRVFAAEDWFLNHGMLYAMEDGAQFDHVPGDVITPGAFIGVSEGGLVAHSTQLKGIGTEVDDRLQRGAIAKKYETEKLWEGGPMEVDRLWLKTSSHFLVSRNGGRTAAMIAVTGNGMPGQFEWEYDVEGHIWSMLVAGNRLYVVTREGKVYCFGGDAPATAIRHENNPVSPDSAPGGHPLASEIIRATEKDGGYGYISGGGDAGLIEALVEATSIHFVVAEENESRVEELRRRFDRSGLYGTRISVLNAGSGDDALLPYIYELMVFPGTGYEAGYIEKAYSSLRPYGGAAFFTGSGEDIRKTINSLSLANSELIALGDHTVMMRQGELPGSASWTHQYGSAANRTYSDDELVKPPLGTLWFGGPSNLSALPRHHNGPIPQVAGGRLFILGVETLSARCVYTGREIWVKELPGIGHPFTDLEYEERFASGTEVYMPNHPGANFIGSPYVSLDDAVYVIDGERLLTLDPATGATVMEMRLPTLPGIQTSEFGHLVVWGDYLVTTVDPQIFGDGQPGKAENWNATSSSVLLVLSRHTGEALWTRRAGKGFRHNAITAGNGKLFIVDGLSDGVVEILQRRGLPVDDSSDLFALDIGSGRELWSFGEDVFATWLGYYEETDMLLQGGRRGQRGAPGDEPNERLIAHNGSNGDIIWENGHRYSGPLGLHNDMIIPGRPGEPAFSPLTGELIHMEHPITGERYRWDYHRYYGCGTMNTSRYLVMFRSGVAGYTDLYNFGGTGNLGGFRAGCTNNMVAAGGVLNAPDYTRTCTCSYPLQTSVGLVHMPDAGIENWMLNRLEPGYEAVRSLGINFAAQGNRRENGVLWLEYPKVYGAGPDLPVTVESSSHDFFRNHATWIENSSEKYNWVASYGLRGVTSVTVDLVPESESSARYYNVTLYFAEPENIRSGDRLFDVSLQGEKVLEDFDIAGEAGGPRRVIAKQFSRVRVDGSLRIDFAGGDMPAVISGIEIVMDETGLAASGD